MKNRLRKPIVTPIRVEIKPAKIDTKRVFDEKLVRGYPFSNRKLPVEISTYGIGERKRAKSHTLYLSPHGIEFYSSANFIQGTLLRINVTIPGFWQRKRRLVDYHRVEPPECFRILARVVRSDIEGEKSKHHLVLAQTVNIDKIDEQVLTSYLQEGAS